MLNNKYNENTSFGLSGLQQTQFFSSLIFIIHLSIYLHLSVLTEAEFPNAFASA